MLGIPVGKHLICLARSVCGSKLENAFSCLLWINKCLSEHKLPLYTLGRFNCCDAFQMIELLIEATFQESLFGNFNFNRYSLFSDLSAFLNNYPTSNTFDHCCKGEKIYATFTNSYESLEKGSETSSALFCIRKLIISQWCDSKSPFLIQSSFPWAYAFSQLSLKIIIKMSFYGLGLSKLKKWHLSFTRTANIWNYEFKLFSVLILGCRESRIPLFEE